MIRNNLLILLCAGVMGVVQAQPAYDFPADSATIGVFVFDYQYHSFEGGTLANYPISESNEELGLPLAVSFQPAGDFGWICLQHLATDDTVFFAGIIWAGTGEMFIPETLMPADSFALEGPLERAPKSIRYGVSWMVPGEITEDPDWPAMADSIWSDLSQFEIVHQFASSDYHVLIYLYPPTVGAMDPSINKWLVFVYLNPLEPLDNDFPEENIRPQRARLDPCYPNPFNNVTVIPYTVPTESSANLSITDVRGMVVENYTRSRVPAGDHTLVFESVNDPSGVYIYSLEINGQWVDSKKMLLVK